MVQVFLLANKVAPGSWTERKPGDPLATLGVGV
jgi:hypothetical protein